MGFLKSMSREVMMEFSTSATSPVIRDMMSPLAFGGEKSDGQAHHLAVHEVAYVAYHAAAQRYDAGRTQEAGHGLGKGHYNEPYTEQHEGPNGTVGFDLFRYKPVEVVDENIFQVAFAPRNKGV